MARILWLMTIVIAVFLTGIHGAWGGGLDRQSCSFNGKKLYGKVQIVSAFPDLKIEAVSSFADLSVQVVTAFPDRCGKWQFVTAFPDLKVQFVKSFADLKVRFVDSFPGLR